MDIGGAETHILSLASSLIKMGHAVTLISAGGAYIDEATRLGISSVIAPTKRPSVMGAIECKRILRRELSQAKYDVVHAHTRYTAHIAARTLKGTAVPLVVTAHLTFSLGLKKYLSVWGDATLAVSEDIKDYLTCEYRLSEDSIITTVNGIDSERFSYSPRHKKRIIHTSRLDRDRSLCASLLLKSAEHLLKSHPAWEIVIAGDGEDFSKIKAAADRVNLALKREAVILTGAVTDVERVVSSGSIFVGVSRSALEGASAGLAVILCGNEGYGGILCKDNFAKMAKTNFCARDCDMASEEKLIGDLEALMDNPSQIHEYGEYLSGRVREDFSGLRMANDAIRAYQLSRTKKRSSAAVIGYFGYGNLGDEETLGVISSALNDRHIEVIHPTGGKKRRGALGRIRDTRRAIRASHIVILGGGNLLQNETSIRSLIYYCEAIRYARRCGKRILVLSSGLGEISGSFWRKYAMRALLECDFLGLRTDADIVEYAALSSLCERQPPRPTRMPDLCFTLPSTESEKEGYIAFIISKNGSLDAPSIREFARTSNLKPLIISIFDREDKERAGKLSRELSAPLYLIKSREELLSILSRCTVTVSERLHGAVFSILSKTPVFLDTARSKCEALVKECELVARKCGAKNPVLPLSSFSRPLCSSLDFQSEDFDRIIGELRRDVTRELNRII